MMVNYVYDLQRLDKYRTGFGRGKIAASRDIQGLKF
jgi:hypothetical protein